MNKLESESEHSSSLPAAEAVDAIENLSGVHPGYRRAHAAGVCCRGLFRPSGLGKEFTEAGHLQEQQVNAVVRFSGSSTDPVLADLLSPAKGLAVQFVLPDGEVTNLVGVTVPVFFARTPESFIDIVHMAHRLRTGTLGPIELMKEIVSHFSESKGSSARCETAEAACQLRRMSLLLHTCLCAGQCRGQAAACPVRMGS
ncbi:catalase [Paenibacillus rhizoplanae]